MDKKILWRTVNAGFLVCAILFGMGSFLGISSAGLIHAFAAFGTLFLLGVLGSLTLRGRILLLSGAAFVLAGAGIAAGWKNVLLFWQSYFLWLGGWQQAPEQIPGYELVQTILIALFCYLTQILMEKDSRFQIGGIGAVLLALVCFLFLQKAIPRPGVSFLICYAAVLYVQWSEAHWKKKRRREDSHAYMLWIMPFLALYFLLMLLPPVPEEPYDWQFVRTIYGQLRESFLKFSSGFLAGNGDDYDLSLSGFSERGRLGGRNEESHREIMTVECKSRPVSNLYLTGKIYDTFDGRQWRQRSGDAVPGRYMDTAQTLYAVKKYDGEYQTDYLARLDLKISYRDFRSEFLFAPLKALEIEMGKDDMDFRELGGSFYFDKRRGYGTEYEVSFYQLNSGHSAFRRFLEEVAGGEDEDQEGLLGELEKITGEKTDPEETERCRQEIYDSCQERVVLTGGVERYLEAVTAKAGSDVEKLKAIEAELSSFSYTLTPGELPESVESAADFLDYFLLESRKGYCNYFATAFVLLARAEGLPARYVQGFCVPVENKGETVVYSDMAHAWPEVYFEGIGWIPFEPTPGYGKIRYASWKVKRREELTEGESSLAGSIAEREKGLESAQEEIQSVQEESETGERLWRFRKLLGITLLLILPAFPIFLWLNRLAVRARYRRMSLDLKFAAEVGRNLRILAFLGVERRDEETLEEFQNRAELLSGGERELWFLRLYEDFLYGDKRIDEGKLEEVKEQREELLRLLKERKRRAYIFYRIFYQ